MDHAECKHTPSPRQTWSLKGTPSGNHWGPRSDCTLVWGRVCLQKLRLSLATQRVLTSRFYISASTDRYELRNLENHSNQGVPLTTVLLNLTLGLHVSSQIACARGMRNGMTLTNHPTVQFFVACCLGRTFNLWPTSGFSALTH